MSLFRASRSKANPEQLNPPAMEEFLKLRQQLSISICFGDCSAEVGGVSFIVIVLSWWMFRCLVEEYAECGGS